MLQLKKETIKTKSFNRKKALIFCFLFKKDGESMNKNTIVLIALIALSLALFGCTQQPPTNENPPITPPAYQPPTNTGNPIGLTTEIDNSLSSLDNSVSGLVDAVDSTPDFPTNPNDFK